MIAGNMRHHDSAGNEGLLRPGGVQWMTAGSGLIHSELPEQSDGLMEGFQLWLNLPSHSKMIKPSYRDIPTEKIPEFTTVDGIRIRVIAGRCADVAGAVTRPDTEPLYLDISMPAGTQLTQAIPVGHNAFTYTYRGSVMIAGTEVPDRNMALLANDGGEAVRVEAKVDARLLLIAGKPLGEPIVQYGPFVMNTADEIQQTLRDYRDGFFEAASVQAL
jgi:redox-sensitive bicupin YhaK (pirin superfamily)